MKSVGNNWYIWQLCHFEKIDFEVHELEFGRSTRGNPTYQCRYPVTQKELEGVRWLIRKLRTSGIHTENILQMTKLSNKCIRYYLTVSGILQVILEHIVFNEFTKYLLHLNFLEHSSPLILSRWKEFGNVFILLFYSQLCIKIIWFWAGDTI